MSKRANADSGADIPPPLRGRLGGGASQKRRHTHLAQDQQILNHAQILRRQLTDAEKKLWSLLRSRQLEKFKFRRQCPIDHYIADFVCLERRLILELDGGQHGSTQTYDAKRTAYLESQGFHVVRFWNNDVLGNPEGVVEIILNHLHCLAPPPPTLTLPRKGGGDCSGVNFTPESHIMNPETSYA
jgi:very-short-patch-repair endonuclease